LNPSIALTAGFEGKWTEEEDSKLKNAVQTHGAKNWKESTALVPGRTKKQCQRRWHDVLDPSIDRANGRTGKWAKDEDSKLKDAVQTHGGKNWGAITALVPGRTQRQCRNRWDHALNPSIARGTWTEDEDIKLKDAVQTHDGRNWDAIAALVPGRTNIQCRKRSRDILDPSIGRATARTGAWSEDEDIKLKDAAQMHGGKNWVAIAELVPGRTQKQCLNRWHNSLTPIIALTAGREGKWTEEEDSKLKDAVQRHGGKK
jgi:myb proto-oncogene protein